MATAERADDGERAEPLLPAAPAAAAPSKRTAAGRWRVLRHVTRSLQSMDSKAFMAPHGRVITRGALGESSRFTAGLQRRISVVGGLIAPPDKKLSVLLHEADEAAEVTPAAEAAAASLQTNGEAIVNLLNNCLGSGMLSMGFAIAKAGILPALGMMLFSAVLNRYTLLLNVTTNGLAKTDPASAELGAHAFGGAGRVTLILLYSVFGFLCCVSYVDAAADAVEGLLALVLSADATPPSRLVLIGCWAALLLPTTLVRSLKAVALLSFVAFLGGVVMLVAVSVYCAAQLAHTGLPALGALAWGPPSAAEFMSAFPILLLVFSIQAGGGVVLATMRDTSAANVGAVSRNAYALVFAMDFFIGAIAYVTFTDGVQGNVLRNFAPESPTAIVARLALLDLVVLSYMIMMIPCKLSLIDFAFGRNEARLEASAAQFYGVTLALNLAAVAVALLISDLSLVLSLNGAVCTNLVAFVLPVALYLKVRARAEPAVPPLAWAHAPQGLILAFGILSLVLGTVPVVQRFVATSGG